MEFLALNPRYVLECGCVNENHAKRTLIMQRTHLRLINRNSLDETLFRDRQPHLVIDRSTPPYSSKGGDVVYNKLQWVSAASLLVVWDYLARHLPTYTAWYASQPKDVTHTKAAVLIDPRYSEVTFAVTMNVMYNLGPGWNLYIYCSSQCDILREEFRGYRVTFRQFEDLPLQSAYKVSKWLMDVELWSSFKEEKVLIYQADSLLMRRFAMDEFTAMDFPFIGGYGPGVGADMRTPLAVGMNGGLSLRIPRAMQHCLETITPEMVNDYRRQYGLETVPYNPSQGVYYMEDIYYYHALELLSYSQPSIDIQRRFSVQSAYFHHPQGIHGFDKG
mmetsp:Transcript_22426/g.32252  ORF Transcript_22426/g.32252 Transcript_22426/m.32252 type:complete len:332 (+) Transcript_22426:2308-3303(+)